MFSQESRSRCALGERVGTRHPLLLSRWSSAGPPCTSHKPSWCSVASDSIAEITHAAKALVDYVGSVIALRFPCPVAAHSASKRRRPPRRSVSTRRMNSRMSKNTSEAWDTFQKLSLKYRDPWDTFQKLREIRLDEALPDWGYVSKAATTTEREPKEAFFRCWWLSFKISGEEGGGRRRKGGEGEEEEERGGRRGGRPY